MSCKFQFLVLCLQFCKDLQEQGFFNTEQTPNRKTNLLSRQDILASNN